MSGSLTEYPHYDELRILADGCTGGCDSTHFFATMKIQVPTNRLWDFLFYVYGLPSADVPTVGLPMPMSYPYQTGMYADSATWEAFGVQESACEWLTTIFTISFRTWPYDITLRTVELKFSGQVITLPEGAFVFPSDGTTTKGAGIIVPESEIVVTYHRQFSVDYSTIQSLTGKVNNNTFQIGTILTATPGTVQYMGADVQIETFSFGWNLMKVTHSFNYRAIQHNWLMNPHTGIFEPPQNANGDPIYEGANLNVLTLP